MWGLRRDGQGSRAGRGPVGRANKGRCPIKAAAEAGVQARAHCAGDSNDSAGSRALAFGEEVRGLERKVGAAVTGLVGQRVSPRVPPESEPHSPGRVGVWR